MEEKTTPLTSTVDAVMAQMSIAPVSSKAHPDKISVIGAGSVGAACLFALVASRVSLELVLIDKDINLARDELIDIENASVYMGGPSLVFSSDYEKSADSKVIIVTAGQPLPLNREVDMNVLKKNVHIYKEIIPELVEKSPKCVLLIVTNPVDIMSYVAWKLSGLPPHRIVGTGCTLLSARFRHRIAQRLGVSTGSVHAFIIGENGLRSVPVWTGITVCGVRLRDINQKLGTEDDPEDWQQLFMGVLKSVGDVVKTKAFNTWGTASAVNKIVSTIIKNRRECLPVSTYIRGCRHGVDKDKDVFLSLPCILGSSGVTHIVRQVLSGSEKTKLQESADKMHEIITQLNLTARKQEPPKQTSGNPYNRY